MPIVIPIYYLVPNTLKNLILFIASLFFYAWGENIYILVMLGSLTVDYFAALLIDKGKRRTGLLLSIFTNLSLLIFFKYSNFLIQSINDIVAFLGMPIQKADLLEVSLPLGISFYTFQSMSYTIDVYRGQAKANHNFLQVATYVAMFPQLVAGPIVKYVDVCKELVEKSISVAAFYSGLKRFIVGLAKKMIIANQCGYIADSLFELNSADLSTPFAWLGIIAYTFQLYFDFSGYSDMAIGLGRMLGFSFLENFNFPFISKSMREFWTRWHISLSTWTNDYIFLPLCGTSFGRTKIVFNLFITFLILGIWHGANWTFVVFGAIHGATVAVEHMTRKRRRKLKKTIGKTPVNFLGWLVTMLIFIISMVFFRSANITEAFQYMSRLFTMSPGNVGLMDYCQFFYFGIESKIILLLAAIFSVPILSYFEKELKNLGSKVLLLEGIGLMFLLVVAASYIATDSYNPFIYFRF